MPVQVRPPAPLLAVDPMTESSPEVQAAYERLRRAASRNRSLPYCLRLWARFVRVRDGNRCVNCHGTSGLSAHHICRKSFMPRSQLDTGNGITLCRTCHSQPHAAFNGKPDLQQPMDAEGGENIDILERLYRILHDDAEERGSHTEEHYHLSPCTLGMFRRFQGLDPMQKSGGISSLAQAYVIWQASHDASV